MMRVSLRMGLLLAGMLLAAGCVNVDAKGPENLWGSPEPSASVSQSDPDSKSDLLRENRDLHARIDWLEERNRRSARKLRELRRDEEELRAEMEQIAAQRDRYKEAAGY